MNLKNILYQGKSTQISPLYFSFFMRFICPKQPDRKQGHDSCHHTPAFSRLPSRKKTLYIPGNRTHINIMEKQQPKRPYFNPMAIKPGMMCGLIKDCFGQPIPHAEITIRSLSANKSTTPLVTYSDQSGYYEMSVPDGQAEILGAKCLTNFNDSNTLFSLSPAEDPLNSHISANGAVRNFMLLPYGSNYPQEEFTSPQFPEKYLGGTIHLSYAIQNESIWSEGNFPIGSVIVIKLIPINLLLASEKITFILNKQVLKNELYINNIPLGRYRMKCETGNGIPVSIITDVDTAPDHDSCSNLPLQSAIVAFTPEVHNKFILIANEQSV